MFGGLMQLALYDIYIKRENEIYQKKINHFREFYFHSKFKKKFLSWMWKSKENKIKEKYHPRHLISFLESETDLDVILNKWIND